MRLFGLSGKSGGLARGAFRPVMALAAALASIMLFTSPGVPQTTASTSTPASASAERATALNGQSGPLNMVEERIGPVSLKFADGELRHIYAGRVEVIRRIYFAVRDANWNTAPATLSDMKVGSNADGSSTISFTAHCKNDVADYTWRGEISIQATPIKDDKDGRSNVDITFRATGSANQDFRSPRVGFCVLFGAGLAGEGFVVAPAGTADEKKAFPQFISASHPADKFQTIKYGHAPPIADCAQWANCAEVTVALKGGTFDMEDQRNYGDSSFKAFTGLYPREAVAKGKEVSSELNIHIVAATNGPEGTWLVFPKAEGPAAKMPKLIEAAPGKKPGIFMDISSKAKALAGANALIWSFCPTFHLTDDDSILENTSALLYQGVSARQIAPDARLCVAPLTFDSPYGKARDPRNTGQFAAAFVASAVKYMALGGIDEAYFDVGPGPADTVKKLLAECAGKAVRAATVKCVGAPPIEAFVVAGEGPGDLWLVNVTDRRQTVDVRGLPSDGPNDMDVIDEAAIVAGKVPASTKVEVDLGTTRLVLDAYGVYRLRTRK